MPPVDGVRPDREDSAGDTRLTVVISAGVDRALIEALGVLDEPGGELIFRAAQSLAPMRLTSIDLDLSGVTGADLAGVRALANLRTALERNGVELGIQNFDAETYPIDWQSVPRARWFTPYEDEAVDAQDPP